VDPTRRSFLKASGAAGASLALGACAVEPEADPEPTPTPDLPPDFAPEPSEEPLPWAPAEPVDQDLFPQGVQSGDNRPDSSIVWTRYAGSAALTLRVAQADGTTWLDPTEQAVTPDEVGVVKLDLSGLQPDTPYAYAFVDADGARSRVGRLRTAPLDDSWRKVRFGATSCTAYGYRPYPCLYSTAAEQLDFFMLLGDTAYCDGRTTPAEYQECWERQYATGGYLELRAGTPTLMTWDDHEVQDVTGGVWDVSAERFAIAQQEYWRYNTIRPADPAFRIWRRFSFGRAVDVFVLDCRSERVEDENRYISAAQMDWLKAELSASTATFKMVMNSVPIGNLVAGQPVDDVMDLVPFILDRWEGYPAQRYELLDHIVLNDIRGVLFVSGDVHFGAFLQMEVEGRYAGLWDIIAGPAGNSIDLVELFEDAPPFSFFTGATNWVQFEADPVQGTLLAQFIDDDGEVIASQTFSADLPASR